LFEETKDPAKRQQFARAVEETELIMERHPELRDGRFVR
jgi:hypothetical protein